MVLCVFVFACGVTVMTMAVVAARDRGSIGLAALAVVSGLVVSVLAFVPVFQRELLRLVQ